MLTKFKEITPSFSIISLAHPAEQFLPGAFASVGEFHNFIEMCYLKSGKAEIIIEGKIYIFESGTLFFLHPLHYHSIRSIENSPLNLYNLSMKISGSLPNEIFDTPFSLDVHSEEKFLSAFYKANAFLQDKADDYGGELAAYELQSLIIDLCRHPHIEQEVLSTPSALTYKSIIETMELEVSSNITLDEIAKRANISRSYLKTLFEKYCDLSPKEYYRKLRLREAIRLLTYGLSVSEIAERMNFSYPNNFTEFFKNETGMTPTEYRTKLG